MQAFSVCAVVQDGIEQGWFRRPPDIAVSPVSHPDLFNILATAKEIVAALAYLHKVDVLHGDLTGNNILLTSSHKDARTFTVKVGVAAMLVCSCTLLNLDCLSCCLAACASDYLFICLSDGVFACLSVCLSGCTSVSWSVWVFGSLAVKHMVV